MISRLSSIALLVVVAGSSAAQGGGGAGRGPQRRLQPGGPPPGGQPPNRAQLEQRVQQRLGQVVKQRLGLNDEQMKKLQETNRRFDDKRRVLLDQERDIRMSLREEMARPDSARQGQVAGLLDRMTKVQRMRVDLAEQEQKELGTFLTPMQRVQYMGAEENIRRQIQEMRQQRLNGRGGVPPDGPDMNGGPPPGGQPGVQPPGDAPPPRMRKRPIPPDDVRPTPPNEPPVPGEPQEPLSAI